MRQLSDCEVLKLRKFMAEDNDKVVGVKILRGYMGVGGSNSSGFQLVRVQEYPIEQLNEREPIWVVGSEICALVNDVLYFRCEADGEKRVYTLDHREETRMMVGDSIAYDTASAARVVLILK